LSGTRWTFRNIPRRLAVISFRLTFIPARSTLTEVAMTCVSGFEGRTRAAEGFVCPRFCATEMLEPRVLLSTYTVTDTNDSCPGSLRQAIPDANADLGPDTIAFNIPGAGVHTIEPASALPVVSDTLTISGSTQPGYSALSKAPMIELSGANAGADVSGLVFGPTAPHSSADGLIVNQFDGDGIVFEGSGDGLLGCYVGTDATGMTAAPNQGNGVRVMVETSVGSLLAARNVISGNALAGIVAPNGVQLANDYIGTNAAGTAALGNGHEGVLAAGLTCGTQSLRSGVVISGNGYSGIAITAGQSASIVVAGTYVGTNALGTAAIGNGTDPAAPYRDGITILGGGGSIGMPGLAFPSGGPLNNVISGNAGAGIYVGPHAGTVTISDNVIGTDATGSLPLGNAGDGVVLAGANSMLGSYQNPNGQYGLPLTITGGGCDRS
jgi:hypothetical protein